MKTQHSKASLFLMELIISLLFFSLASTVCVRLFINAHTLSSNTQNLNYAVTQANNLAECFIHYNGNLENMQSLFENCSINESCTILTVMDEDYKSILTLAKDVNDSETISADISIFVKTKPECIYQLNVLHHVPERRD